jgi:hypothetical protein
MLKYTLVYLSIYIYLFCTKQVLTDLLNPFKFVLLVYL